MRVKVVACGVDGSPAQAGTAADLRDGYSGGLNLPSKATPRRPCCKQLLKSCIVIPSARAVVSAKLSLAP
jgi:hypothetical protein